jgi:hypothetical protein
LVSGGEGFLDHPELVVGLGLQLQDHTAVADRFGLKNSVVLAATMNIGDWVT